MMFEDTLNLFLDVWNKGVGGTSYLEIFAAIFVVYVFFALRRLFTKFVLNVLSKWAAKTKYTWDDKVVKSIREPLRLIPITIGIAIAGHIIHATGFVYEIFENSARSLIVVSIFWIAHNLIGTLIFGVKRIQRLFTAAMTEWLVKVTRIVFILLGVATVLEVWGIDVGPILAGFGLAGVGVALAAQDLFKNLIGGILVLAEKRFKKGDWIKVDGVVEGTVEQINFRSTEIRRFDKALVQVPNAQLSDTAVTNFSEMTNRRIYWVIGLEYRTTGKQLRNVREKIEQYIMDNADFETSDQVSTFVRVDAFNASSIDIMIYCFTKTTNWGEWLKIKEDFAFAIKDIVEGEGASFAFPSQSLYIEKIDAHDVFLIQQEKSKPEKSTVKKAK